MPIKFNSSSMDLFSYLSVDKNHHSRRTLLALGESGKCKIRRKNVIQEDYGGSFGKEDIKIKISIHGTFRAFIVISASRSNSNRRQCSAIIAPSSLFLPFNLILIKMPRFR